MMILVAPATKNRSACAIGISIDRAFSPIISELVTWRRKWCPSLPPQLRSTAHVRCETRWPCILSHHLTNRNKVGGNSKFQVPPKPRTKASIQQGAQRTVHSLRASSHNSQHGKEEIQVPVGHPTKNQTAYAIGSSLKPRAFSPITAQLQHGNIKNDVPVTSVTKKQSA